MRILVLDDEAYRHREFVTNNPTCQIDSVYTWQDAVDRAKQNKYDYICIDHDLGWSHSSGALTSIPFVRVLRQMLDDGEIESYTTRMVVHSSNPVGAQDILSYFSRAQVHAYKVPFAWAVDNLFTAIDSEHAKYPAP